MPKKETTPEHKKQERDFSVEKQQYLRKIQRELIEEFRRYMHVTHDVLRLASKEETEALRIPLLAMELKEEVIAQWEHFRRLVPTLLYSARELKRDITLLLNKTQIWTHTEHHAMHTFFDDTDISFEKKKTELEALQKKTLLYEALEKQRLRLSQEAEQYPSSSVPKLLEWKKFRELPVHQRRTQLHKAEQLLHTEKRTYEKDHMEKKRQEKLRKEQEEIKQNTIDQQQKQKREKYRQHLAITVEQLPDQLIPLYRVAIADGRSAMQKLHVLMKTRKNAHQNGTPLLIVDADLTAHATRDTLQDRHAAFSPKNISYQSHAIIVSQIHTSLLHDMEELERKPFNPKEAQQHTIAI